jgi:MEMO1 family protein
MAAQKVRESVIAGTWYPGDPRKLKTEIEKYLEEATTASMSGLIGLVVPHAGYVYSGRVAAHAYKALQHQPFDRVLILAPSHRAHFQGASTFNLGGFRTPLGIVPLDHEIIDALDSKPFVRFNPQAHDQEHSLEIQLPFLQVVLKDFVLTPIVMGEQSFENCRQISDAIVEVCRGKHVLLIASSDLSHFHSYDRAKELDQHVLDRLSGLDPEGLSRDLSEGQCEACGGGPMVTIMLAARELGARQAKVLRYANSGDVTGDHAGVVGYVSAALYRDSGENSHTTVRHRAGVDLGLSGSEKSILLDIAKGAIRSHCTGKHVSEPSELPDKLKEHRGAFVCIKKAGELRGCIGMTEGRKPLHRTIHDMAIQAAFSDPRFCAVGVGELEELSLEISVLTPMEKLQSIDQIEIGKHGLLIRKRGYSGLLLPQVATEHGWNVVEFLEWTCQKAGLPKGAWKDEEAEIYIFSADIF